MRGAGPAIWEIIDWKGDKTAMVNSYAFQKGENDKFQIAIKKEQLTVAPEARATLNVAILNKNPYDIWRKPLDVDTLRAGARTNPEYWDPPKWMILGDSGCNNQCSHKL